MKFFELLPWNDWLAMLAFFSAWIAYARFAKYFGQRRASLMDVTKRYRLAWMLQTARRDQRVIDGIITQGLGSSSSFFASTTVFIIGGLAALLGTTDKAIEWVQDIPFTHQTPVAVFEFKIILLIGIFVYAFFRFTWAIRQHTIVSLVIGAMPSCQHLAQHEDERWQVTTRAGRLLSIAAETFNDGLRAYYFSFATLAWFFSTWAFVACTAVVIGILYRREFQSEMLQVLKEESI